MRNNKTILNKSQNDKIFHNLHKTDTAFLPHKCKNRSLIIWIGKKTHNRPMTAKLCSLDTKTMAQGPLREFIEMVR